MIKVAKFGGSSLADEKQFEKVRNIVNNEDERKFIVVSACGKAKGKARILKGRGDNVGSIVFGGLLYRQICHVQCNGLHHHGSFHRDNYRGNNLYEGQRLHLYGFQ